MELPTTYGEIFLIAIEIVIAIFVIRVIVNYARKGKKSQGKSKK